ncbi:MAG: c-type cytochrome [Desulfobacterales bacterium]
MKTSGAILVIFLCLFFVSALSAGEQGEEIFKSNGCIFCHKPGRSSGTIPSLPDLAKAYKGNQQQLVRYLNGEADPIVKPERAGTMKRQIEKTKSLSDSERTALADFMLSH